MRILIVGTGPVSYFFYNSIKKKYGEECKVILSDFRKSKNHKQDFFGPSTFFYRGGYKGLGKYWHGVLDVDLVKSLGEIENSSYFSTFNKIDKTEMEFVPYLVPRFKTDLKIVSEVIEVIKIESDGITVRHYGFTDKYDYVFFGVGFGYNNDPLVNSGLVKRSDYISDHVIFNSSHLVKDKVNKSNFLNGHYRNYSVQEFNNLSFKRTFRPALSKSIINPKNKAIYTTGTISIIKNLVKSGLLPQIVSSLHLRYGLPPLSNSGYNFYQTQVKDIYKYNKKGFLELNIDLLKSTDYKYLFDHLNIDKKSLLSGIHLHGGYSSIESNNIIAVNKTTLENERVIILTPNINCQIDSRHFTSYFMRMAELIANNLKVC